MNGCTHANRYRRGLGLATLAIAALLSGCEVWGKLDNPVDPQAPSYEGTPQYTSLDKAAPIVGGDSLPWPKLRCNRIYQASAYELQVAPATDTKFVAPINPSRQYTTAELDITGTVFVGGREYICRVRAIDAKGVTGPWSAPATFVPGPSDSGRSPADAASSPATPYTLAWAAVEGAASYEYQTAASEAALLALTTFSAAASTSAPVTGTGAAIWWRFRAVDEEGAKGLWSKAWSFTSLQSVATPTLSPAAGAVEANTTISFSCATAGATIRFTTGDGTQAAPTSTSGTQSTSYGIGSSGVTIKVAAFKAGMADSTVVTATYGVRVATVSTFAGSGTGGFANGTGTSAQFSQPKGVAVDAAGTVFVADTQNHQIRKITSAGVVTTFAGSTSSGSVNGTGTAARFTSPEGIAVDGSGNLYVADTGNNMIRKITSAGVVTTIAGSTSSGSANGTGTAARFSGPRGVAIDGSGNLYVADTDNDLIRKITSTGVVTTLAGSGVPGSADGTGASAQFNFPLSVAVDASGTVYVADYNSNRLRRITSSGAVTTLASGSTGLYSIYGVAVDAAGTLFAMDINVKKVSASGVVTTVVGGTVGGSADGVGSAASFYYAQGLAIDPSGAIYVADSGNHKIRKVVFSADTGKTYPLDTQAPTQALILAALEGFSWAAGSTATKAEARLMLSYMGADSLTDLTTDSFGSGLFGSGREITIWPDDYGVTTRYGLRYGTPDRAYFSSNATYFTIDKTQL